MVGTAIKASLGVIVDLGNPEYNVLIEVIDHIAGVSVLHKKYKFALSARHGKPANYETTAYADE
jgi:tRNA(Ser,Leu) C12 N-acetylase TAN1